MQSGICIIVPCFNEANRLAVSRFVKFAQAHPRCRFIMVNDGSDDDTLELLVGLNQRMPWQFEVLDLKSNCGKAEAVRQGILRSLNSDPCYVGFWDADLATPLQEIIGFANVLDSRSEIDLVLGSRIPLLGHSINRQRSRKTIGWSCSILASLTLGCRIRDTQCGAKLFRVNDPLRQVFNRPTDSKWLFDVEILARLMDYWKSSVDPNPADRIFEYPLQVWNEIPGSSLAVGDIAWAGVEMAKIFWKHRLPFSSTQSLERPVLAESETGIVQPNQKRAA